MFDLTADPKACDKLRAMDNVDVYPYQDIVEFTGSGNLEGVRFQSNDKTEQEVGVERYVTCDGIFEYIGLEPVSAFCADLGILDKFGCIEVDAYMRTAVEGIFAAGDINVKHLRQIVTACSDGATAANTAAKYVENLK